MFIKETENIEGKRVLTYTGKSGEALRICPDLGATICQISLFRSGRLYRILDEPTREEIGANRWYKGSFMIPFPNRIQNGKYRFSNMIHQLPVNEEANNNAIHGFTDKKPYVLNSEDTRSGELNLSLSYAYPGDYPGFPFPFLAEVSLRFSNDEGLAVGLHVTNTGESPMPLGMGWHPYYKFDCPADQLLVHLPSVTKYNVDSRYIPDGSMSAFDDFAGSAAIGSHKLDHCFKIQAWDKMTQVRVTHPSGSPVLRIWQEMGEKKFNYLVVFTPPWRDSFAVEPMSCNINAFNNGDGLFVLKPGERAGGFFGVQLED